MDPNENLLRPDEVARHTDLPAAVLRRPAGWRFAIGLDVISVILAGLFGWGYWQFLARRDSTVVLVGILFLFGVATGLQALLTSHRKRRLWVLLAETFAVSVFFYRFDTPFFLSASVLFFVVMAWGYYAARRELNYTTEFRFFSNTRPAVGGFITATLLFMVLLYVPNLGPGNDFVSEHSFSGFFNWAAGLIETWSPGIPLTGSFSDLARGLVSHELQGNPAYDSLTSQAQSTTVAENAAALIENFSKNLGIAVQSSDTVANVVYSFVANNLASWQDRFTSVFLVGWTVVVFIILRGIGIVFVWLDQLFLGAAYEILSALGLVAITETPTTKETVGYK